VTPQIGLLQQVLRLGRFRTCCERPAATPLLRYVGSDQWQRGSAGLATPTDDYRRHLVDAFDRSKRHLEIDGQMKSDAIYRLKAMPLEMNKRLDMAFVN
jgi:hypothetical protein